MINIHVGSGSSHKVSAVADALHSLGLWEKTCIISHSKAKSKVSDQPYDMEETMLGAMNRARSVWKEGEIAIGIEGGLIGLPLNQVDPNLKGRCDLCMAVVCLINQSGEMFWATSAGMQFPNDAITEWVDREIAGEENLTVGKVLAEKYGGDHTDPRAILSKDRTNRRDSIAEAVKLALLKVF